MKCAWLLLACLVTGCLLAAFAAPAYQGQTVDVTSEEARNLAYRFAPILYLHPEENFYPISVDYAISISDLMGVGSGLVAANPTPSQLALFNDPDSMHYLDNKMGTIDDDGIRDDFLANGDDYLPLVYARVTAQTYRGQDAYAVQYFFYYAFNDGPLNTHEGDWETVMVVCSISGEPIFTAYSQHLGGEFAEWGLVGSEGNSPKVYVARGSHANYYRAYEGRIGPAADVCSDSGRVLTLDDYELEMLDSQEWLDFAGHWGEYGGISSGILGERGPLGPKYQGDRWDRPMTWAEGLQKIGEGWLTLNWAMANMTWILFGIMALVLLLTVFGVYRRKRKQGTLGPRLTPFLYIGGMNARSAGTVLAIAAMAIGMLGFFMPWYTVSIDIAAGEYSTPGPVNMLSLDGINGLRFARPEPGAGMVQLVGLPVPFGWLMLFGLVIFLVGTIGIANSRKFGRKLLGRGIGMLIPAIIILLVASIVGAFINGYVQDAPPEVADIINTISRSPFGGTTTEAMGDYGAATLRWGIGAGAMMFFLSSILFFVSAAVLMKANHEYFPTLDSNRDEYNFPQSGRHGGPPHDYDPYEYPDEGGYWEPDPVGNEAPPGAGGPTILTCPRCGNTASAMPGAPAFRCMRCGEWMYPPP